MKTSNMSVRDRKFKFPKSIALLSAVFLVASAANAAVILTYDIGSTTGAETSIAATGVAAGINASALDTIGVTESNPVLGGEFVATSWGATLDTGKYYEFTITPQQNYSVTYSSITYGLVTDTAGVTSWTLRSSVDNYTGDLATHTISNDSTQTSFTPDISGLGNQSSAVTFRQEFRKD